MDAGGERSRASRAAQKAAASEIRLKHREERFRSPVQRYSPVRNRFSPRKRKQMLPLNSS